MVSAEPFSHGTGTLQCLQNEMATWSVSLWRNPDDVPHYWILSPDKIEWQLISATLCQWWRCFVADQLWFMTHIREEDCLHDTAPEHLSELLVPASTRSSRHCLRSSNSNKLVVPPVKLPTHGQRAFTVSGPVVWNSLPEYLRDPTLSRDSFRRYLKTYFFALLLIYSRRLSALKTLWLHALYKFLFWSWLIVLDYFKVYHNSPTLTLSLAMLSHGSNHGLCHSQTSQHYEN